MTTTTNLGLQQLPSNSLQPDVPVNAALVALDASVAGTLTFNFASDANLTLTATQSQNSVLVLTDTTPVLTASRDVVFPAHFPLIMVKNSTAQSLALNKSGQTGVTIAAGDSFMVASGASDVVQVSQPSSTSAGARVALNALSIAAGVVNIDCSLGDYFTLALTANVTSITFSNLPASGKAQSIGLRLQQDATGSRTVAIPTSLKAITGSDTAVQSAANAYTILHIETFDQGTRWEYSMKAGG